MIRWERGEWQLVDSHNVSALSPVTAYIGYETTVSVKVKTKSVQVTNPLLVCALDLGFLNLRPFVKFIFTKGLIMLFLSYRKFYFCSRSKQIEMKYAILDDGCGLYMESTSNWTPLNLGTTAIYCVLINYTDARYVSYCLQVTVMSQLVCYKSILALLTHPILTPKYIVVVSGLHYATHCVDVVLLTYISYGTLCYTYHVYYSV